MRLTPTNPLRSALMSVLVFEVIVFWLAFAGMVQVSGVAVGTAALWARRISGRHRHCYAHARRFRARTSDTVDVCHGHHLRAHLDHFLRPRQTS